MLEQRKKARNSKLLSSIVVISLGRELLSGKISELYYSQFDTTRLGSLAEFMTGVRWDGAALHAGKMSR